ncbi:MAG TPA: pitrilysin family protein, partial [Burkholderiaceae bacterium]|nr:pitrilysin family protein [Burkholderiaceae bacterium]
TGTLSKTRAQLGDAFDALQTDWDVQGSATGASASLTTKRQQLVPALQLLAEVLRQPRWDAQEFEQMQRQAVQGLQKASQEPDANAGLALARKLHPYASDDVRYSATFQEDIAAAQALKLDAVQAFYARFWGADHADLGIVGDFDPKEVQAEVTRAFGDWKSAAPYARVPQPASEVFGQHLVTDLPEKANAIAIGELPLKLSDNDPDYPALVAASHVLGGGGFDSRLLVRLRQKEGVSYSVGSGLQASAFEPAGDLELYAIYAPQNRAKVVAGFDEEFARFVKDGITAAELADAKKAILAGRATTRTSDAAVAGGWAVKLRQGRTFAWSADQDAKLAALTVDDVNAAIRKWFAPAQVDWSLAGTFAAGK